MTSETPSAKSVTQREVLKQRNTEVDKFAATGTVEAMRAKLVQSNSQTERDIALNQLDKAELGIDKSQQTRTNSLKRKASFDTAITGTLGALSVAHAVVTLDPLKAVSGTVKIVKAAVTHDSKQQKAILEGQELSLDHVKAIEKVCDKSFTKEQKDEFTKILQDNYGGKKSELLDSLKKLSDTNNPKPLAVQNIEKFLDKSAKGKMLLNKSVSRALNDNNPALKEHRSDLARLMTDDKTRAAVMAKLLMENIETISHKTPKQSFDRSKSAAKKQEVVRR